MGFSERMGLFRRDNILPNLGSKLVFPVIKSTVNVHL